MRHRKEEPHTKTWEKNTTHLWIRMNIKSTPCLQPDSQSPDQITVSMRSSEVSRLQVERHLGVSLGTLVDSGHPSWILG